MVKKSKTIERQNEAKKIHVTLSEELHKKVKVKCAYDDLSIQFYVEKLIREDLEGYTVQVKQKK